MKQAATILSLLVLLVIVTSAEAFEIRRVRIKRNIDGDGKLNLIEDCRLVSRGDTVFRKKPRVITTVGQTQLTADKIVANAIFHIDDVEGKLPGLSRKGFSIVFNEETIGDLSSQIDDIVRHMVPVGLPAGSNESTYVTTWEVRRSDDEEFVIIDSSALRADGKFEHVIATQPERLKKAAELMGNLGSYGCGLRPLVWDKTRR